MPESPVIRDCASSKAVGRPSSGKSRTPRAQRRRRDQQVVLVDQVMAHQGAGQRPAAEDLQLARAA
ncbi:hypothetical protein ABZW30_25360 [Kitasatospora sp. NPDC004669]|uniref:hypothetical protein n=1 Tax=Kitasatospora sp. NPDC004669 TaxID=3154555 RepID=UPI0033BDEDC6